MQVTYNFVKPIAGGGLGDCKVGIVEFDGTYASGGVDVGLKEEPMFMIASGGYGASFAEGMIEITSGGEEVTDGTSVAGVKVLFVIKGSY